MDPLSRVLRNLFAIFFLPRWLSRRLIYGRQSSWLPEKKQGMVGSLPYLTSTWRNENGSIYSHEVGVPLLSPVRFVIRSERRIDGFWKSLGLLQDYQLGDPRFDSAILLRCNHFGTTQILKTQETLRTLILDIISKKKEAKLTADGRHLWLFVRNSPGRSDEEVATQLNAIAAFFQNRIRQSSRADPNIRPGSHA